MDKPKTSFGSMNGAGVRNELFYGHFTPQLGKPFVARRLLWLLSICRLEALLPYGYVASVAENCDMKFLSLAFTRNRNSFNWQGSTLQIFIMFCLILWAGFVSNMFVLKTLKIQKITNRTNA